MQKRSYATWFILAVLLCGALLALGGLYLRHTALQDLPQYRETPDIAIPLMLLKDRSPLQEARARAEWEARQSGAQADETAAGEPSDNTEPAQEAQDVGAPAEAGAAETQAPSDAGAPGDEALSEEGRFDHTLFIGDSRTDGLRVWGRLGKAEYFCGVNYSVYNILEKRSSDEGFRDKKLEELLAERSYEEIWLMLGYNEAGYPFNSLMKQYSYVIARVREAQPKAKIVLYGIMHAGRSVAQKHDHYSIANLDAVSEGLRGLAAESDGVEFVPCTSAFYDADGYLLPEVSNDGEHLKPERSEDWAQEIAKAAPQR